MPAASRVHYWAQRLRTAWSIFGVILLIVVGLEGGLRILFFIKDYLEQPRESQSTLLALGEKPTSWTLNDYQRGAERTLRASGFENAYQLEWHSYVYWRRRPITTPYTNIDSRGLRHTWRENTQSQDAPKRRHRIFVFGGSTVWGSGCRDDYTLPSHLSRLLTNAGLVVEVVNFGETGYVVTQDLLTLLLQLREGNRPDLVIFYSGINDVCAALMDSRAGVPQNERLRRYEFNLLRDPGRLQREAVRATVQGLAVQRLATAIRQRVFGQAKAKHLLDAGPGMPASVDQLAHEVVRIYEGNVQLVLTLTKAYGFEALFYWQPAAFTKKTLTPYENEVVTISSWNYYRDFLLKVYEAVNSAEALTALKEFRNISAIFDQATDGYYIDPFHLTEEGNAVVAQEIAKDVTRVLQQEKVK